MTAILSSHANISVCQPLRMKVYEGTHPQDSTYKSTHVSSFACASTHESCWIPSIDQSEQSLKLVLCLLPCNSITSVAPSSHDTTQRLAFASPLQKTHISDSCHSLPRQPQRLSHTGVVCSPKRTLKDNYQVKAWLIRAGPPRDSRLIRTIH